MMPGVVRKALRINFWQVIKFVKVEAMEQLFANSFNDKIQVGRGNEVETMVSGEVENEDEELKTLKAAVDSGGKFDMRKQAGQWFYAELKKTLSSPRSTAMQSVVTPSSGRSDWIGHRRGTRRNGWRRLKSARSANRISSGANTCHLQCCGQTPRAKTKPA